MKKDFSVSLGTIRLKNPVMNCSGTFEPTAAACNLMRPEKLGAVVSKTITLKPRLGNNQPRAYEVFGGLINRIGLQNPGVKTFTERILDYVEITDRLFVSIGGESIFEYVKVAEILQQKAGQYISALELNVSCPNVKNGMAFGSDPKMIFGLAKEVKRNISLPLIIKLTPNVLNISQIARAAQGGGADVLSLINTVRARAFIGKGPDSGRWIEGGLSGPAIKHIALQKIFEVSQAVSLPLIAMGGISGIEDALDFLRIDNVKAIAVGTASFCDPGCMVEIIARMQKSAK